MINRIPDYLKLFIDDDAPGVENAFSIPQVARFCNVFPEVTGLKLSVAEHRNDGQLAFPWSSPHPAAFKVTIEPTARGKLSSLANTREFEESLAGILNLVVETRRQLQLREAELAAAVPVISVDDDHEHLAQRLHYVLRSATTITDSFAAALYMLDEATTSVKLRAFYGLDPDALLREPRRLEDAVADVEALAGHAVVIENTEARSRWQVPQACRAAMCVPVSTATTILGTLWLFRAHAADFTVEEQDLAEIIAGRLASDLDRAVLTQEVRCLRKLADTETASTSASPPAPKIAAEAPRQLPPRIEGWEFAAGTTATGAQSSFCEWFEASPTRLHLAVGSPRSSGTEPSAMAFRSIHAAHMSHDSDLKSLMAYTNQSLWRSTAAGQEASLFHAILDPSCGRLEYTLVGDLHAYILRPHAWEPLLASPSVLGVDESCDCQVHRQILMPGDILFATSLTANRASANAVAEKLLHNIHLSGSQLEHLARNELAAQSPQGSVALLVAKRDESS